MPTIFCSGLVTVVETLLQSGLSQHDFWRKPYGGEVM